MEQLSFFSSSYIENIPYSHKTAPICPGKPNNDVSIQPNGQVLYRGKIGWFSRYEVALEYGYKGCRYENTGQPADS